MRIVERMRKQYPQIQRGEQPVTVAENPSEFITKREVANRIKKSTRTVEIWSRLGIIPHLKIGRSVLFSWPDVQAQLRSRYGIGVK